MVPKSFLNKSLLIVSLILCYGVAFSQADVEAGATLFRNNCGACHARDMKSALTGPALGGAQAIWESEYSKEDLYAWIRNSQASIQAGQPRAVKLWDQYKPTQMTAFPALTDQEIANILAYVDAVYNGTYGTQGGGDESEVKVASEPADNTILFIILAFILGLLALVLARIVANLNYMNQLKEGAATAQRKTLLEILLSRGVIGFVIFALVVFGGYTTVNNAIALGRQQGYQPEQPIKFSHATHAGLQKIDCQYCHDGARRSKQSVIPAANTCMNCHKAIKVGSQYGTAEISKIFASIGYDPNKDQYIPNYENMSEADIEAIFKNWIGNNYVAENGTLDEKGEELIASQWTGIKNSLTNENKPKIQGPIEWIRIHNLPDHAYFNHAQHVTVGKVACQTCHGPVEEMEIVKQYSPLSMGWCVNCHRQTEVQFKDNEYYDSYKKYHEEIASGKRSKVTVEEIGGIECQKCHY